MITTKELTLKGEKVSVFDSVEKHLESLGFRIVSKDLQRPWGGFFVIDESQAENFAPLFFPELKSSH